MAGPTRLELATSGVTGRRSNRLNYDPTRGCHYKLSLRSFQLLFVLHVFESGDTFLDGGMSGKHFIGLSFEVL